MVLFEDSFWFSVYAYMFHFFGFINRYLFRFQVDGCSGKENSNCAVVGQEDNRTVSNCLEKEPESKIRDFNVLGCDGFDDKEKPKFCFKFQYQTTSENNGESENSISPEMASTSKYQFMSGKDFSGFMEEPEIMNFTVEELYVNSNDGSLSNKEILDEGFLSSETKVHEQIPENSICNLSREVELEKPEAVKFTEDQFSEKEQLVGLERNLPGKQDISDEVQFLFETGFFALDSDPESISLSEDFSDRNNSIDSNSEEFLSERGFGEGTEIDTVVDIDEAKVELIEEFSGYEETHFQNSNTLNAEAIDFDEEYEELKEELENSEPHLQNSSILDTEILSENDFLKDKPMDGAGKSEEPNLQNSSLSDSKDSNELETLWEHQDLIEQLKMDLRKVRGSGLPTILEESESPKMMEDLKPWKTDEKFQHKDRIDELDKFYKSYTERMRKLDILNYQKMYTIGFLQLKDPLQSISSRKSSTPGITSLLSQNFRLYKCRKPEADPTMKLIKELQSDLEMVYVGQVCLSWEFLNWQYRKAQELQVSDPNGFRQYNQVAGEFQQFQVLMQRFLENEPFQEPRVQNYVKNRCVLRNLLQVPVVKDDCSRNKKKGRRGREEYGISIAELVAIIEESMRIFWTFLRNDKDEANVILKGLWGTQVELQDPADSKLLMDIRANLQKKEKRLKDILRSGNCIVRRFQKHQEYRSEQVLHLFCQVDMKLVSRVLNMSRIRTDQLVWCHKKLNKINFVGRKVHVESSFLLFPC
ncbi:hypothetical protein HHK36_029784 [Tetracentron sinense]|uniref:Uncharacterized protein n=1 Tax=Tetracentron sinense TaxID=13715 RepID=A0A834YFE6_TETSI|nr:hypothetical protein HHK36_029784 [Tetracentron sinense]